MLRVQVKRTTLKRLRSGRFRVHEETDSYGLVGDERPGKPFVFDWKKALSDKATTWAGFFRGISNQFDRGYGRSRGKATLDSYQRGQLALVEMWLRHLVADREFDRGDVRAIVELLDAVCWYALAGEQRYRDRYLELWEHAAQIEQYRVRVWMYLRSVRPQIKIRAWELHTLPRGVKKLGAEFLRKHGPKDVNLPNFIKDVFRKPKQSRRRPEFPSRINYNNLGMMG